MNLNVLENKKKAFKNMIYKTLIILHDLKIMTLKIVFNIILNKNLFVFILNLRNFVLLRLIDASHK